MPLWKTALLAAALFGGLLLIRGWFKQRAASSQSDVSAQTVESAEVDDRLLVLTPDEAIHERIELEPLSTFVMAAESVVREHVAESSAVSWVQVGCALVPGPRLILEIQTVPMEQALEHARLLTPRLRALSLPRHVGGAVAFALQLRGKDASASEVDPDVELGAAFGSFVTGQEPISLDDVLIRAGHGAAESSALASPVASVNAAAHLSQHVDCVVSIVAEPVVYAPPPLPFTIEEDDPASTFVSIRQSDGARQLVDRQVLAYFRSANPQPTQCSLSACLANAERVRVYPDGMSGDGEPVGGEVLVEITEADAIASMREALRVLDGPAGHCMCLGEPTLEFLSGDGKRLAVIGLHHGHGIRWTAWKDDAALLDGRRLLEFLAEHGVKEPLAEYESAQVEREQEAEAWRRWAEAMPKCLRDLSEEAWDEIHERSDMARLQALLAEAMPDVEARIRALLRWFGAGAGPWTGYPAYEALPAQILAGLGRGQIVAVLRRTDLTEFELEGAARFFATWSRGREGAEIPEPVPTGMVTFHEQVQDASFLPVATRRRLLEHCEKTEDEDKRARARKAFAE